MVKQCSTCQENRSSPTVALLPPWQWPSQPWSRVHLDFAGPYNMGHMFLVILDAHSKWLDAYLMNSITSSRTIVVKRGLKCTPGRNIQEKLSRFLFDYRITPHATTGVPPCQLLMNRQLRSRFGLLYPTVAKMVEHRQLKQREQHDKRRPLRVFVVDDPVYAENFASRNPKWIAGTIVKVTGPLSYVIKLNSWSTYRDTTR